MTQMVKVSAEPANAMMVSKDGMRMAIRRMTTIVAIRIEILRAPRADPEMPIRAVEGMVTGERPKRCSIVTTIGRALMERKC